MLVGRSEATIARKSQITQAGWRLRTVHFSPGSDGRPVCDFLTVCDITHCHSHIGVRVDACCRAGAALFIYFFTLHG